MNMQEFITRSGLRMTHEPTDRNPHMDDSTNMDSYRCVLRKGHKSMAVYFSKGSGHHGQPPTLDEVLDCLAIDASGLQDRFEDWAAEYGCDTDSRKAERTYLTIQRQAKRLRELLGDGNYDLLLNHTERL